MVTKRGFLAKTDLERKIHMKKRIVSLLVLVCMLFASVPALVLPVLAEGEAAASTVTKLEPRAGGQNAPTEELRDGKLYLAWQGGWRFVSHSATNWLDERELNMVMGNGGPSTAFTHLFKDYTGTDNLMESWVGDAQGTGLWAESAFFGYYNQQDRDANWGPTMAAIPSLERTAGYQYTAEKGGKVNITVNFLRYLRTTDPGVINGAKIAVFVAGKMVWPQVGDYYADASKWAKVSDLGGEDTGNNIFLVDKAIATLTDITVRKADKVEVLVRVDETDDNPKWHCRSVAVDTTVEYVPAEPIVSKLEPRVDGKNAPAEEVRDGKLYVKLGDGWKFTSHSNTNWLDEAELNLVMGNSGPSSAFTDLLKNYPEGSKTEESWIGSTDSTGLWADSAFMSYRAFTDNGGNWGPTLAAIPSTSRTAGYQYNTPTGGTVNILVDNLRYVRNVKDGVINQALIGVFVGGKMVWPQQGDYYSDASKWAKVSDFAYEDEGTGIFHGTETIASVTGVSVRKGEKVEVLVRCGAGSMWECRSVAVDTTVTFTEQVEATRYFFVKENGITITSFGLNDETEIKLPEYEGTSVLLGYDTNGDGVADAKPGDTYKLPEGEEDVTIYAITAGRSEFSANRPVWDDVSSSIKFRGGWTVGILELADGTFNPFAVIDSYNIASVSGQVWGGTGGGLYLGSGLMAVSGCMADELRANSIRYSVQYNAKLSIDFTDLRPQRQEPQGAGPNAMEIAIYVGGKKVWPANDDWYVLSDNQNWEDTGTRSYDALTPLREAGIFPMEVTANAGDMVEIRSRQHDVNCWMFWIAPTVTYTELIETPVVSATSVSFGKDLGLNAFVNILGAREGVLPGLEYWTAEPTAEQLAAGGTKMTLVENAAEGAKFTYRGFAAKQMTDKIWVRPYSVMEGEEPVYGQVVAISIADYAKNAFGRSDALDKVIAAMVNYGSNAQSYFNYNRENMANSFLPDAMKVVSIDDIDLNNVYAQSGTDNKINSVSMILGDRLGYKFITDKVDGATSYVLEYADNADFTNAKTIDMVATEDGEDYKAIVTIDMTDASRAFYFRVKVDGTAGATLTYNFDSYYVRMESESGEGLYYLMMSIIAFNRAASAYEA